MIRNSQTQNSVGNEFKYGGQTKQILFITEVKIDLYAGIHCGMVGFSFTPVHLGKALNKLRVHIIDNLPPPLLSFETGRK